MRMPCGGQGVECGNLNENVPPQAHVFECLIPGSEIRSRKQITSCGLIGIGFVGGGVLLGMIPEAHPRKVLFFFLLSTDQDVSP